MHTVSWLSICGAGPKLQPGIYPSAKAPRTPPIMGGPIERPRRHLGLVDRRHRVRLMGKMAAPPTELRRGERRQVHHAEVDAAVLVQQLAAQRIGEAAQRVLGATVRGLQRYRTKGERRAHLD